MIFTLIFVQSGYSQGKWVTKVKTIEKEFDNNVKYIDVNNNYGNINISYWNEKKLKARVTIKVEASEEKIANSFIKKICPVIKSECDEMNICDFGLRPKYFYTNDKNHNEIYGSGSEKNLGVKQFRIDIDLLIPYSVDYICVTNNFGNISIPDYSGNLQLFLSNGNLKTGKLNLNDTTLPFEIRNGEVNIKSLKNSKLVRFYSCKDVKIGNITNVNLYSNFSNIQITDCSGLNIDSKSDNITIDNLESLEGTGSFTDISIKNLYYSLILNDKSGTIEIENIDPGFKTISLAGQYNDYILNLDKLNYTLHAELEFTDFESPESILSLEKRKELISGANTFEKIVGNNTGKSIVRLKCSNCNVTFK